MGGIEEFFLEAVVAFALRELLIGQLAVEGDDAREILLELAGKDEAAFGEILAVQLFDGFSGALDEICEADAEFNDAAVVRIVERFRDDAAVVEQWPERIAAAGVIMAGANRRFRWISTYDHKVHSFTQLGWGGVHSIC